MENVTDIGTKKTRVARLLSESTPTREPSKDPSIPWTILGISLIGTMIPFQIAVAFFSFMAVLAFIVYTILARTKQIRFSKPASGLLVALLATSVLSGCAPAILNKGQSSEIYSLIHEREYKYHTIEKIGFFGLGLEDLTIENAQFEGNIETVYVAKLTAGHGIISLSRITVAGE